MFCKQPINDDGDDFLNNCLGKQSLALTGCVYTIGTPAVLIVAAMLLQLDQLV